MVKIKDFEKKVLDLQLKWRRHMQVKNRNFEQLHEIWDSALEMAREENEEFDVIENEMTTDERITYHNMKNDLLRFLIDIQL